MILVVPWLCACGPVPVAPEPCTNGADPAPGPGGPCGRGDFTAGVVEPSGWAPPPGWEEQIEPEGIGDVIGSWCGVDAYQNGSDPLAVHGSTPFGWAWQSTELALRYLCTVGGLCTSKQVPYGTAAWWYDNTAAHPALEQLVRHPNGGVVPPAPGDLLVLDHPPDGHVAIITHVVPTEETVAVLEQNHFGGPHGHRLIEGPGGSWNIEGAVGWMSLGLAPRCAASVARPPPLREGPGLHGPTSTHEEAP
jgi:hypothetical protein